MLYSLSHCIIIVINILLLYRLTIIIVSYVSIIMIDMVNMVIIVYADIITIDSNELMLFLVSCLVNRLEITSTGGSTDSFIGHLVLYNR